MICNHHVTVRSCNICTLYVLLLLCLALKGFTGTSTASRTTSCEELNSVPRTTSSSARSQATATRDSL